MSKIELKYKATKFSEKVQRKIVWLLPRSIVMRAYIRVLAHATSGKWGNTIVADITAMEALKRWDEEANQ